MRMTSLWQRYERWWVVGIILVAIALQALPTVYGALVAAQHGGAFVGSQMLNQADYTVYISHIEQARQGAWIDYNLYTSEPQRGLLVAPLWFVLGWVARLLGLSSVAIFHVARLLLGALFLWAVYRLFVCRFFTAAHERLLALVLVAGSSGLGALWVGIIHDAKMIWTPVEMFFQMPTDLWLTESNTFATITNAPLGILSQLLLLVTLTYWLNECFSWRRFSGTLGAVFFLSLLHPYNIPLVVAVSAVWLALTWYRARKITWWQLGSAAAFGGVMFAIGLYFVAITSLDPVLGGWAARNTTFSPPFLNYLLGFGLLGPLAFVGAWQAVRRRQTAWYFLIVWCVVALGLIYWPVNIQRRFINGFHLPLALLAARGMLVLWQRVTQRYRSLTLWVSLVAVAVLGLFLTTAVNLQQSLIDYRDQRFPYTVSADVAAGWRFIRSSTPPGTVILSESRSGNLLPAFTGRVAYVGHGHQTLSFYEKQLVVEQWFFTAGGDDAAKADWLRREGISYVWYGDRERALGSFSPETKTYLAPVFTSGSVTIYRVAPGEPRDSSRGLPLRW